MVVLPGRKECLLLISSLAFGVQLSSAFVSFSNSIFSYSRNPKRNTLSASSKTDSATTSKNTQKFTKAEPTLEAKKLKHNLICNLKELRRLQARDGDFSDIDWGTKGGELTETGRVPRTVDYSVISPPVGAAAQRIFDLCQQLQAVNPTPNATQYMGDKVNGDKAPLNGAWKLLFSNAADAVFSKDSKRGAAKTQNVVDAAKSRITNVIDFEPDANGTQPVLKQLNVVIKATPQSEKRVQLDFRYAKVVLTKLFFIPLFGRTISLYIPVPATFVTRCIAFFQRIKRFFTRRKPSEDEEKRSTRGYFDILYLDSQLRIHKTGQGNLFVQTKEDAWEDARPLIR